jgi:hypothetical protein
VTTQAKSRTGATDPTGPGTPVADEPLKIDGQGEPPTVLKSSLNQPDAADNDDQIRAANEAELDRQRLVNEAVRSANQHELPKLGGPMLNPGAPPEAEAKAKT